AEARKQRDGERRAHGGAERVAHVEQADAARAVLERQHAMHRVRRAGERWRDGEPEADAKREERPVTSRQAVQADGDRRETEHREPGERPRALSGHAESADVRVSLEAVALSQQTSDRPRSFENGDEETPARLSRTLDEGTAVRLGLEIEEEAGALVARHA